MCRPTLRRLTCFRLHRFRGSMASCFYSDTVWKAGAMEEYRGAFLLSSADNSTAMATRHFNGYGELVMTMTTKTEAVRPELIRRLNGWHATAIVVGTIIGSGIFLVPAEMMQAVGSAQLVYLAWMVGGVLSFFGALTYAELGAMKPQAGGEYVYVRDAYGPLLGFLYGWSWFVIAKPASIATVTTGLVRILGSFSAFAFFSHPIITSPLRIDYGQLVAILATVIISVLNYVGIKRAGEFQLIFTLLKVAIILGIVGIGFSYSSGG